MRLTTLAVGGIAAGTLVTGEGNSALVVHSPSMSFEEVKECKNPMERLTLQQSVYRRMTIRYILADKSDRNFEFWVDEREIQNEHELIIALANGYRPVIQRSM